MNKYEMLYIIKNDITDEAKQEVVDKMAAIITSRAQTSGVPRSTLTQSTTRLRATMCW